MKAIIAEVAKKRGPHNRLGWGLQWGTARMLGAFLADPDDVPHVAVDYVAEQLGVGGPFVYQELRGAAADPA